MASKLQKDWKRGSKWSTPKALQVDHFKTKNIGSRVLRRHTIKVTAFIILMKQLNSGQETAALVGQVYHQNTVHRKAYLLCV